MNTDLVRSFFAMVEHGSLSKAAARQQVSQSTLTRQLRTLEQEIGGRLFDRTPTGVALTAAGHALLDGMKPVMAAFERAVDDARRLARGQSSQVRVGYLLSAAADYLNPALSELRRTHPEVKVKLVDLSPGEQIAALRNGEIDLGFVGNAGSFLSREFYVRRIATLPVVVALPSVHRLATLDSVALSDLKDEVFVGAPERDLPGNNRWITRLCRRAKFRPRFLEDAQSLSEALANVVAEGAVALLPDYTKRSRVPGVIYRPLRDAAARWEFDIAWQRGKATGPLRALLDALPAEPRSATSGARGGALSSG